MLLKVMLLSPILHPQERLYHDDMRKLAASALERLDAELSESSNPESWYRRLLIIKLSATY